MAIFSCFFSLSAAGAVTMGLTALVFGRLTVFTVFVLALLAGMGIDFGIHLLGRIRSELQRGRTVSAAIEQALFDTGSAMSVAALTTAGCILVLLVGHFSGFREFAVIAACGTVLSLIAALLAAPPLAVLVFTRPQTSREPRRGLRFENVGRFVGVTFCVGIAATAVLLFFVPRVSFEQDFRNLRGPKTAKTIGYGKAVGKRAGTAPSIVLGQSRAQMDKVHELLLERRRTDPRINSFITASTFVPQMEKQERRRVIIEEIGEIVNKVAI